jgi:DNA-directed RNA polymerase specialized sigma24 family protein
LTLQFHFVRRLVINDSSARDNSPMSKNAHNNLFDMFSNNPNEALKIYQRIYRNLLIYFAQRKVDSPDDLASETVKRVLESLATGKTVVFSQGEEQAYFFGFAKIVLYEFLRKRLPMTSIDDLADDLPFDAASPGMVTRIHKQREMKCVTTCFSRLAEEDQALLEEYYPDSKSAEDNRKHLADTLDITPNALKHRIVRIKKKLAGCKGDCMVKMKLQVRS